MELTLPKPLDERLSRQDAAQGLELIVTKTRYIVPYRVRGQTVEILRVFHTSRRLPEKR